MTDRMHSQARSPDARDFQPDNGFLRTRGARA